MTNEPSPNGTPGRTDVLLVPWCSIPILLTQGGLVTLLSCVHAVQSTYDTGSIYEPIVPRPPSQMSGYSSTGSSLYSSYYPGGRMAKPASHRGGGGQEAEVDHLTDLLVQSMDSSGDPDFFGEPIEGASPRGDERYMDSFLPFPF